MHDRGAEAADDPRSHAGIGDEPQEVEILHDRESRADGEAEDRRIHQEPDPVRANQHDDHQALQQFLGERRDVAREMRDVDPDHVEHERVHAVADAGNHYAARDDGDNRAQAHQLVAVEIEQRPEEDEHRQQDHQRMGQDVKQHRCRP